MKNNFVQHVLVIASIVFISSCKLSNSGGTNPPIAQFGFVNASPDAPGIDVYANGGIVALGLNYGHDTGYFVAQAGTYKFQIAPAGTTSFVIESNITFNPAKAYSIFTIDSLSKIKTAIVVDSFATPPSDSVRIRFFHFSPNEVAIDLGVAGVSSPWFSGRIFNDQNSSSALANFGLVKAGTYDLEVRTPGIGTIITTQPGVVLEGGKGYTLYLKGFAGGTGTQALGIGVIKNN